MRGLKNAPCKECTERYPGCHDHCQRFLALKQEYDSYKERAYKEKTMNYMESVRAIAKSRYRDRLKKR